MAKPRTPRKKTRTLVRWDDEMDKRLLLTMQAACNAEGIKIPWDRVAQLLSDNITGGAVVQHMAKLRQRMEQANLKVPPVLKRGGTSINPLIANKNVGKRRFIALKEVKAVTSSGTDSEGADTSEDEEDFDVDEASDPEEEYGEARSKSVKSKASAKQRVTKDAAEELTEKEDEDEVPLQPGTNRKRVAQAPTADGKEKRNVKIPGGIERNRNINSNWRTGKASVEGKGLKPKGDESSEDALSDNKSQSYHGIEDEDDSPLRVAAGATFLDLDQPNTSRRVLGSRALGKVTSDETLALPGRSNGRIQKLWRHKKARNTNGKDVDTRIVNVKGETHLKNRGSAKTTKPYMKNVNKFSQCESRRFRKSRISSSAHYESGEINEDMGTHGVNTAHRFGLAHLPTPGLDTHADVPGFLSQQVVSDGDLTSSTSSRRPFSYLDADADADAGENGLASGWNQTPGVDRHRSATNWVEQRGFDRGPSPAFPTYPISGPAFPTNTALNSNPYALQGSDQFNQGIDTVMTLSGPQGSPASAQPWMLKEPLALPSNISMADQTIDPNILQRMDQVYPPLPTHTGVNAFVQPFPYNAHDLDWNLHAATATANVYDFQPDPSIEANNNVPIEFDPELTGLELLEESERYLAQIPDGDVDPGWEENF